MSDENELLFDELYEKTKDCGRVQFIKLLMQKEIENQDLKKQLNYLRSGEYYNQLRWERDMLQYVVDNGEVSKEDKDFIDTTHRNTELLEQKKEFVNYLNSYIELLSNKSDLIEENEIDLLKEILSKYKEIIGENDGQQSD